MGHETHECEPLPECQRDLKRLSEAVFGNGKPENALLTRMRDVEADVKFIKRIALYTLLGVVATLGNSVLPYLAQVFKHVG